MRSICYVEAFNTLSQSIFPVLESSPREFLLPNLTSLTWKAESGPGLAYCRAYLSPRLGVLNNIPFAIPFDVRVSIFRSFIRNDAVSRGYGSPGYRHGAGLGLGLDGRKPPALPRPPHPHPYPLWAPVRRWARALDRLPRRVPVPAWLPRGAWTRTLKSCVLVAKVSQHPATIRLPPPRPCRAMLQALMHTLTGAIPHGCVSPRQPRGAPRREHGAVARDRRHLL